MDTGQNKFFDFILERTQDGRQVEMTKQLQADFKRQQEGTFDAVAFAESCDAITAMLKPECIDEFKKAMEHFGKQM